MGLFFVGFFVVVVVFWFFCRSHCTQTGIGRADNIELLGMPFYFLSLYR